MNDITLIQGLTLFDGRFSPVARLYYYQGNFFKPLELNGCEAGRIKRAIRQFLKDNAEMVKSDRSRPEYRTLPELFNDQMAASENAQERL